MTSLIFEISYFSDKEKTVTSALYVKIFPLQAVEFFFRRLSTGGSPLMVKKIREGSLRSPVSLLLFGQAFYFKIFSKLF